MEKLKCFLFAIYCLTTLIACSNNEEPVIEEEQVQEQNNLTSLLTVGFGADTRTRYAQQSDGSLKVTWDEGDDLSVVWWDDDSKLHNTKFHLISGDGNKTGVFVGEESIPAKTEFSVFYPYTNVKEGDSHIVFNFSSQTGRLEDLDDYDAIAGIGYKVSEFGLMPFVTITHRVVVLRLPIGLQLFAPPILDLPYKLTFDRNSHFSSEIWIYPNKQQGPSNPEVVTMNYDAYHPLPMDSNGKLTENIYIVFQAGAGGSNCKLKIYCGGKEYAWYMNYFQFTNGKIYTLTQETLGKVQVNDIK